ncbi:hypothetical protein STEG23_009342, partial [Scotinomys teguina]
MDAAITERSKTGPLDSSTKPLVVIYRTLKNRGPMEDTEVIQSGFLPPHLNLVETPYR